MVHSLHCKQCGVGFSASRARAFCGRECEKRAHALSVRVQHAPRPCGVCKQDFTPTFGWGRPSRYCGEQCKAIAYAEHKRRGKRVGKSRRRARLRGAEHQAIDPIAVFGRDKWQCHLCGCKTPQRLRGTCDPRAPELDHIVSLADGGSHTWGNVACACRACNGRKGAQSLGQLGLSIAA